jgi:hypothetical protein
VPSPPTKRGTRKLSDVARHVVVPIGITSTGYPAVRDKCRDLGILHDDWQQGLGRLILAKRDNGKYAATVGGIVMSIPRQVGKTFTVGSIIFALCLLFPGSMILWTAHRTRTSNETFRSMRLRENLPSVEAWLREGLGIWDPKVSTRVIDEQSWADVADQHSTAYDRLTLAVDVSPNRSTAAVSLSGRRPDGLWHVELDEHRKGADWVPGWIEQRAAKNKLHAVVADEMSGLVEQRRDRNYLKGTGIEVTLAAAEGRDMAKACAAYFDAVMTGAVRHTDQPQVNVALSVAGKRPVAGAWAWNRRDEDSDITPVVSQTLALWGAQNDNVKRPKRGDGGGRRAVLM